MAAMRGLKLGRLEISGSILFGLALICWQGIDPVLPLFVISAALHELGHIMAAACLGIPVQAMRISLSGAELVTEGHRPPLAEGLLLAAGPGMNLLQAPLCTWLDQPLWAGVGLLLGIVNLLPTEPLDGGGLLRIVAEKIFTPSAADRLCRWVGWLTALTVLTAGGWVIKLGGTPLLLVFGCWLMSLRFTAS